jgi:prepilin-type N-terminal cleavage/methylation domain-containing protein
MYANMERMRHKLADSRGFTLIEMAIVLIIIGIIIGAVVKGKDVMKNAEQKRLYSTFVREWQMAYNNYYDRTGWILGDDATATNATRDGIAGGASEANLVSQLTTKGLTPPSDGPTGTSNQRTYTDSFGRQFVLTLTFANSTTAGNHIQITSPTGVPFDLGLAWDKIIDGSADGDVGDLLYDADITTAALSNWPNNAANTPPASSGIILRLEF